MDDTMSTSKDKPIHEVRIGAIKAALWKNETVNGVRYNCTFSRLYRDQDQWKSTDSFGRDDLLLLAKVANDAHTWIHQHGPERDSAPAV
jgi:hypothetical protein